MAIRSYSISNYEWLLVSILLLGIYRYFIGGY